MKFTHLHLHTHYSILDGMTKIDELAARLVDLGMDSCAITDHGNMYGAIEFYKAAKDKGIKPIIGCEVYMAEKTMVDRNPEDDIYHLILLAKNMDGYRNLIKLVSEAHLNGMYYKPRIDRELLKKYSGGLVCLSACLGGELSQAVLNGKKKLAEETASWYKDIFGEDYYIELQKHEHIEEQTKVYPELLRIAKKFDIKVVATADCHYLRKDDNEIHDVLLAVQTKKRVDDNERLSLKSDDFSVISSEEMIKLFEDCPEAISNTQEVVTKCNLQLQFGKIRLPHYEMPDDRTPIQLLSDLANEGMVKRGLANVEYGRRLEYEKDVIEKTGFATYLLIVQDIINWAKNRGIPVGPGRGSAAGSLLCYCLGITNIDPIKHGLLFERFMNPDRISMPDIDMDFDDEKRDEVIGYINKKYGHDHVAQIITFGTMGGRSAIRDAGRAMDIPLPLCDRMAKLIPPFMSIEEAIEHVSELESEYNLDSTVMKLLDTAKRLEGVVRHIGTHACGIVITKDATIDSMPVQLSSRKDGSITTQYGMKPIDELGLLKMDFLGLNNLTIIRKTTDLIKSRYNVDFDIDKIPSNDKRAFQLLQDANTTSVFQLESDGMKRYLKQLKPTELNDITAMVSLYRPGPIELIPEYIARKHKKKVVTYLHPLLEPILKDTYGIMIYQEQLMAACRALAGLTLAQADILRKAVGKKIKSLLDEQESKFKDGAKSNGIPDHITNEFWALVEPFNRYGFNKSHAVSYATIAYQTAYLKSHYPIEFMAAVMNCDSSNIERITILVNEAQGMGIKILPPSVNESMVGFTIDGSMIRFGLSAIKGLGADVMNRIVSERDLGKKYDSVSDFIGRVSHKMINKKVLDALARCGAMDEFSNRNTVISCMDVLLAYGKFDDKDMLPELWLPEQEEVPTNRKLAWERELIGLYVSENPVNNYVSELSKHGTVTIANAKQIDEGWVTVGGIIGGCKSFMTRKGDKMMYCILEDATDKADIVIFPRSMNELSTILVDGAVVVIRGKIESTGKIICFKAELIDKIS